jgi:hypothetical protein
MHIATFTFLCICVQITKHNICAGRGDKDMYRKLLKNGAWRGRGKGEYRKGLNRPK